MIVDGPSISRERLARFCTSSKQALALSLIRYTQARDLREDCFDFISDCRYDRLEASFIHSPEEHHG